MKQCTYREGSLILVNAAHPYGAAQNRRVLSPVGDVLMERRAAVLLNQLMVELHGWSRIAPVSGWRSAQEQRKIWDDSMAESGETFTRQYVAVPGSSEHQTGLAIDLGLRSEEIDFIRPDFPYTGICGAFRARAARYGFIERYPAGKENITGIAHEPWHFRYVGAPHAALMEELGLTLEEYHIMLKSYPYGSSALRYETGGLVFHISYLPAAAMETLHTQSESFLLSGNNMDGFIRTEWSEA